ncbi:MAG: hypothetical protein J0I18_16840 [Actinobacteria bacterium]|nr:hypothetical protein [Actinomycetota bacterium]
MSADEFGALPTPSEIPLRTPAASPAAPTDEDLPSTVLVVNWRTLTNREAAEAWEKLADWVGWLYRRYPLPDDVIRNCWYRHGGVVEELSALHACWQASFDESDSGYGPIGFHERLDLARNRLRTLQGSCGEDHVEDRIRDLPLPSDWSDWIRKSHAHPKPDERNQPR